MFLLCWLLREITNLCSLAWLYGVRVTSLDEEGFSNSSSLCFLLRDASNFYFLEVKCWLSRSKAKSYSIPSTWCIMWVISRSKFSPYCKLRGFPMRGCESLKAGLGFTRWGGISKPHSTWPLLTMIGWADPWVKCSGDYIRIGAYPFSRREVCGLENVSLFAGTLNWFILCDWDEDSLSLGFEAFLWAPLFIPIVAEKFLIPLMWLFYF